jgi:hypothetical protein
MTTPAAEDGNPSLSGLGLGTIVHNVLLLGSMSWVYRFWGFWAPYFWGSEYLSFWTFFGSLVSYFPWPCREAVYSLEAIRGADYDASSFKFDLPVDSEHKVSLIYHILEQYTRTKMLFHGSLIIAASEVPI